MGRTCLHVRCARLPEAPRHALRTADRATRHDPRADDQRPAVAQHLVGAGDRRRHRGARRRRVEPGGPLGRRPGRRRALLRRRQRPGPDRAARRRRSGAAPHARAPAPLDRDDGQLSEADDRRGRRRGCRRRLLARARVRPDRRRVGRALRHVARQARPLARRRRDGEARRSAAAGARQADALARRAGVGGDAARARPGRVRQPARQRARRRADPCRAARDARARRGREREGARRASAAPVARRAARRRARSLARESLQRRRCRRPAGVRRGQPEEH